MKKRILQGVAIIGIVGLIALIWLLDFPSWKQLDMKKLTSLSQTTVIYDENDQPAADMHSGENRISISIDMIPEYVKNAFIAIEDARFYEHCGIDIWRIGGAVVNNIRAGGYAEGASTITQQLIKLTHLTSEKKLSRKAQEAWLALQLEKRADKDEILEMYLNTVYFGKGAYGIEAAAQVYFGKNCTDLTLAEGAMLAGIIKAPGIYAPHISMEKATERRNTVLDAMVREGMIREEEAASAKQIPIELADSANTDGSWYIDWVLTEAADQLNIGVEEVLSGGYRIYTALNTRMQHSAEQLFEDEANFPGNTSDGIRPESALIAINPRNGEIMCMLGGRSYNARLSWNRATQMQRQPGSAIKPISVYAAAIDLLGYTPVSLLEDVVRDYDGYVPSNASGNEYGTVTLRQALARSMNLASVDLITKTGIEAAAMYAKRSGIRLTETDYNLSLALGSLTEGVSPAQMSAAYAPLVNGGYRVEAHTIRAIYDLYGNPLYEYNVQQEYVMSSKSACMITDVLQDAVSYGTAKQLNGIGFPVAAKTGTVGGSDGGNRDAWTVAYTPNISVAVWMGFDQTDDEHLLPEGVTGGSFPARLAAIFLKNCSDVADGGNFEIPDGMSKALIDGKALELYGVAMFAGENTPSAYLLEEILPDENLPVLTSDIWNIPDRVDQIYIQTDSSGSPVISFIALDPNVEYHIIRKNGEIQTDVGCVTGSSGQYVSFVDETAPNIESAEYCVVARHLLFLEDGKIVESEPTEWKEYKAPGILERLFMQNATTEQTNDDPIFKTDELSD